MTDPLPLATRVRKARRSSKVACGHYVLVGQVIVRRASKWACLSCALATRPGMVRLPSPTEDVPAPVGAAQEGTTT